MFRKHSILIAIILSLLFLLMATRCYPGGSQANKNTPGFDWKNNYLSNLFSEKAVNGAENSSRPWAVAGMLFLSISFTLFFIEFAKKIPLQGPARIIKYTGIGAMLAFFLVVTPYHDSMVTVAGTLALVSMFYILVFVFKSRLILFKILSVICMLVFYCTNYLYYSSSYLAILPIMQKILFVIALIWMLGLAYCTRKEDFQHIKK